MARRETLKVPLAPELVRIIDGHCRAAVGTETCGVLAERHGIVCYASGPGKKAVLEHGSAQWDAEFIAGWMEGCREMVGGRVMGRWHKHTAPTILATPDDKLSAEMFRQYLALPAMVDLLIASGNEDEPIAWQAYLCTSGGYDRIDHRFLTSSSYFRHVKAAESDRDEY